MVGFVGAGLGLSAQENLVWYMLFIVFVTYAMLPLPLKCCIMAGCTSALMHIIITSIVKFNDYMVRQKYWFLSIINWGIPNNKK